jgi:hypothetical protein
MISMLDLVLKSAEPAYERSFMTVTYREVLLSLIAIAELTG